ncbi:lantibiotic dehydratase [Pedobacter sp. MR22-3]|uniref:lantibiotic dehydratase n=1 Tax=Pedobacter sp. MR22-3 TaxID=2994552 RepID=UPI0022477CB8|nr:lantibiotic dehydratase [Pedobacter sp. MR22-3]MCX2582181.1 lantibiotic dehydratase [Pedobacter sp. MR22-3]
MSKLKYNGFFLMRSPLLPYESIQNLGATEINTLVKKHDLLREAIFLSSPDFYERMLKWLEGNCSISDSDKVLDTLRKYISRMSYRSTPFGISAGVSHGTYCDRTQTEFKTHGTDKRFCRLDTTFLNRYVEFLLGEGKVNQFLKFFSNNTRSELGNKLRYLEYINLGSGRNHELVSVDRTEFLDEIILKAEKGICYGSICETLTESGIDVDEATEYVDELIRAKILLSELELSPESENELNRIAAILKQAKHPHFQIIHRIVSLLTDINGSSLESFDAVPYYKKLMLEVESLGIEIDKRFIFQVDMLRDFEQLQIDRDVPEALFEALSFLEKIKTKPEKSELERFARVFFDRYEYGEVPLLEALDSEMGIGYPYRIDLSQDASELLSGIPSTTITQHYPTFKWTPWQKKLLEKYTEAIKNGDQVIELTESDALPNAGYINKLPQTAYSVCKLFHGPNQNLDRKNFKLLHVLTSGPSSIDLISRFCYLDKQIREDAIKAVEVERADENVIFAEILHINQPRAGNISKHPRFYDYNIPILSSNIAGGEQIPLRDLMLSVVNGKLLIRSKKYGKRVIPRLSTAHNYTQNTISYYRFLCDLQYQGSSGDLYWDWGFLGSMSYLPRVEYGNVILSRESWGLEKSDLQVLTEARNVSMNHVSNFFDERKIPRYVTIREEDYEMPIDLLNEYSLEILLQLTKKKSSVRLEENLFHKEGFLLSKAKSCFTNDLIIPFYKNGKTEFSFEKKINIAVNKRNFVPGSEWMYFKLYCSPKISNKILGHILRPLTEKLIKTGVIDYWFFIRYNDPEYHLRLRFHIVGDQHGVALRALSVAVEEYLEAGKLRSFKIDTYNRELERYSYGAIEGSERLFFEDSSLVTECLAIGIKDWVVAIKGVDKLLEDFGISLEKRMSLTDSWQQAFKLEFGIKKNQTNAFKIKYRKLRSEIEQILEEETLNLPEPLFRNRSIQVAKLLESVVLSSDFDYQINSYIHMFLNRLFMNNQRKKEMVVYDLLHQHYKSKLARLRFLNKEIK